MRFFTYGDWNEVSVKLDEAHENEFSKLPTRRAGLAPSFPDRFHDRIQLLPHFAFEEHFRVDADIPAHRFCCWSFSPPWKNYTWNLKLSCPEGDLDEIFFQKSLPRGCFEAQSK
jgi:hypothetical protein